MNECESVPAGAALAQGDVFQGHPTAGGGEQAFITIISADCDIARGKVRTGVACLPILPATAFLEQEWETRREDPLCNQIVDELCGTLNTAARKTNPNFEGLTNASMLEWITEKGVATVIAACSCSAESTERVEMLLNMRDELQTRDGALAHRIDRYLNVVGQFRIKDKNLPKRQSLAGDIKGYLTENRVDFFYMNDLIGQVTHPWMIDLRRLNEVNEERLCKTRAAWLQSPANYFRIGRLKPVFKYALSQKFGALYSRIGLPDTHDEWKKLVVDDLTRLVS